MKTTLLPLVLIVLAVVLAVAEEPARAEELVAHGAAASWRRWPSHHFQLAPRSYDDGQLTVNFGLIQPAAFHGFNVAVEGRWRRALFEYSHGMYLDYSATPALGLSSSEKRAGLSLRSPFTTGFGVGLTLIDELYVMVEFKWHQYDASIGPEKIEYLTMSIGPAVGYRFFVWKGLHVNFYLRAWPNVWTNLPSGHHVFAGGLDHEAKNLGIFGNVSVGWAFDLPKRRPN